VIYFVQPVDGGPIKIGCSENVDARVQQLQSLYKRPLSILKTLPGGRKEEMSIHKRFAHLRLGHTEQFRPASDLMEFIGGSLLVGANPETVEAMPMPSLKHGFVMRASPAWIDWLKRAAEYERTTVADFIDRAAADRARQNGFKEAPPKR
jgi:hypothetical protein